MRASHELTWPCGRQAGRQQGEQAKRQQGKQAGTQTQRRGCAAPAQPPAASHLRARRKRRSTWSSAMQGGANQMTVDQGFGVSWRPAGCFCVHLCKVGCDPTGRLSLMPTSSPKGPKLSEGTHPTPLAAFLPPSPPPPAAAPPAATPAAQQVQQGSAATRRGDRLSECAAGWTGVQQPLEYHPHAIRKGSLITASGVSTSSRRFFQPTGRLPPVQQPTTPAKRTCSSDRPHAARHSASSAAPIAAILPSDSFTLEAPVCRWDAEAWVGSVVGSLPAVPVAANRNRVAATKSPLAE